MASLSLVFDIIARDKSASKTFNDVGDSADRAGKKAGGFGSSMKAGFGIAAGAIAAAGLGVAFKGFIEGAAESAKIGRLTEAVVKSTGGAAKITADQIGALATSLSNKTAVDDEAIQAGANLLATFTKVRNEVGAGNDIFTQATALGLDMATALGTDASGAALQLGKALNDPVKGIGALSRAGVSFTAQQKEQIKTLAESGDVLGAQKIILGELQTQFGGAAAAAASPLERLKVVGDNLGESIGGLLLPSIERFATFASDTLVPAISRFVVGFQDGEGAGGRLAAAFETIRSAGTAASDYFKAEILPRLHEFAGFIRDEVVPRLADFVAYLRDDALPALHQVAGFLRETFQPTFDALVVLFQDKVLPRLRDLKVTIDENRPALEMAAKAVGLVAAGLGFLVAKIAGSVLPVLVELVGFLLDRVVGAFEAYIKAIGFGNDLMQTLAVKAAYAKVEFAQFIEKLKAIKVPQSIKDIAELVQTMAKGLGSGKNKLGSFFGVGDGPGRGAASGSTLAKVKGLLPSGTSITSTYRTPAHNRSVGGSPTSYHTDRNNPAVDIAGTTSALNGLYRSLVVNGPWRELLWQVPGHYDHLHVAHAGGTVSSSWARMPGDRFDERTTRLQVGEKITPRGASNAPLDLSDSSINRLAVAMLQGAGAVTSRADHFSGRHYAGSVGR